MLQRKASELYNSQKCLRSLGSVFLLVFYLSFFSCSGSVNYEDAVGYYEGGQAYIKLKRKRQQMVHDLSWNGEYNFSRK